MLHNMGAESTLCKICGNANNNQFYHVREMQLGLREIFTYMHCNNCGCMQLTDVPENMEKYYPSKEYYSFNTSLNINSKPDTLRHIKALYLIYGKNALIGKLLSIGYKAPEYYEWMKTSGVQWNDAILDVGTGNGSLLLNLYKIGFTNLTGVDPFISENRKYGAINIFKKNIFGLPGTFDFIMLHHSFEHMDEPLKVLLRLKELVNPGKFILIRIPMMGMYGWKNYGVNWVGLDAPRHLFLHTIESMQLLCEQAGLQIQKIVFDSDPSNIWASEQYKKDIPLTDARSYMINKNASIFTKEEIKKFKAITKNANEEKQGDHAAFYLYKA